MYFNKGEEMSTFETCLIIILAADSMWWILKGALNVKQINLELTNEDQAELRAWLAKYDKFSISINEAPDAVRLVFVNLDEQGNLPGKGELDPFYFRKLLA